MSHRARLNVSAIVVAVAMLGIAVPALVQQAAATASFTFSRFAGQDRDDTARLVATGTFTSSAGSNTVLLARHDSFPDGLAGAFLTGQPPSALLLTATDSLPAITAAGIASVKAKNVVLLGGTAAISTNVENQLKAIDSASAAGGKLNVTRVAGTNRYDTARLVATRAGTTVGSVEAKKTAVVASGVNFPDALAGGPMAFSARLPILLTDPSALSPEARTALTTLGIQHVVLLGGTAAVSDAVKTQIQGVGGITVERLAGPDRTATAVAIADYELAKLGFSNSHVNLALGLNFPDALAGGPHAGIDKTPILLTASQSVLGSAPTTWLQAHQATLTGGHIFGGTAAITQLVADQAAEAAGSTSSSHRIGVNPIATANPHFSASGTSNEGVRNCTASIPTGISTVDLALFPATAVSTDLSGNTVLLDTDGNQAADLVVDSTGGVIESVNGVSVSPKTNHHDNVAVINGAVSFVIDSVTQDDVVAVVFADANSDNQLNLTGSGTTPKPPSEVFGVGCRTRWTPNEYHPGTIFGPATVTYVDKVAHLFVAATAGEGDATFFYSLANDQLTVGTNPSPTAAGFDSAISPGDTIEGSYRLSPAAPSQLNLTDTAAAPPTDPLGYEHATSIDVTWTPSVTPNTDSVEIFRCTFGACTYTKVATVPAWMTSYTDSGLTADKSYLYKFRAVDEGDASEDSTTVTVAARATDEPLIDQARVVTDAAPTGEANASDVHRFVFSEPMNTSIAANGATYRVQDADATPTIIDIACGTSPATTCSLSANGYTLTVTLGTGIAAGLQYPVTITNVSVGWVDKGSDSDGGTPLDLAGSPDKVIESDTTPPTITDARATTDGGLIGLSGPGDTHQLIFSEPMAAPTDATQYSVTGANSATDTVSCAAPSTCSLNSAPVIIGGVSYEAGRVLTVTIAAGTSPASYNLTITATAGLTDAAVNPVNVAGSSDKIIQVAANP